MRIVCFNSDSAAAEVPRVGALLADGQLILDFARAIGVSDPVAINQSIDLSQPLVWLDLDGTRLRQAMAFFREIESDETGRAPALAAGVLRKRNEVRLLAPVPRPGKLIAIGLNYRDHAAESKMAIPERPVVFSKFTTSVIGPDEPVVLPPGSDKVDYEAELAVVMGRHCRNAPRGEALDYVLGFTIINDVSARDFQFADGQWQRGKSCDTFAPMGNYIATKDEIPNPHSLGIRLRLNGRTMQDSSTSQLIFGVEDLVAFLSETITLEPGDVIATGTPSGVGFARQPPVFLKDGDVMEVEIEGLGVLANQVTHAATFARRVAKTTD